MVSEGSKELYRNAAWLTAYAISGSAYVGMGAALLGMKLWPPSGPPAPDPYTELLLNTTDPEARIPIVYGTRKIGCNYIYKGEIDTQAVKQDSGGGKGGSEVTVGYKYFMDAMAGVCQGAVIGSAYQIYISRMWKNNDLVFWRNSTTTAIYYGTQDQAVDPMFSAAVDNPVPYPGLAYIAWDRYPLGENNNVAPTFYFEVHNYPFHADAGDTARVYTPYRAISDAAEDYGISMKSSNGDIWMVNYSDEIVRYDKDFSTVLNTIDISLFSIDVLYDIDIIEYGGKRFLYILYQDTTPNPDVFNIVKIQMLDDVNALANAGVLSSYQYTTTQLYTDAQKDISGMAMCHNDDSIFVAFYYNSGGQFDVDINSYDFNVANGTNDTVLLDVTPVNLGISANNNDILFLTYQGSLESYTISTMTLKDNLGIGISSDWKMCEILQGGDEVIIGGTWDGGGGLLSSVLHIYGFDLDGDNITFRKTLQIGENTDYFPTYSGPVGAGDHITHGKWNPDGTLLISYEDGGTRFFAVQHIVTSLNPAQMAYDMFVNQAEFPAAKLNTASLSTFGDYCFDNYLGVSDAINRPETALQRIDDLVNMLQCRRYRDNDGKMAFKCFTDADTADYTLTEKDIFFSEDGQIVNEEYGEVILKDIQTAANRLIVSYTDRLENYKKQAFPIDHFLAQESDDQVTTEEINLFQIPVRNIAGRLALRGLGYSRAETTMYRLPLRFEFLKLNQGDLLDVTSSNLGLTNQLMRVMDIQDTPILPGITPHVIAFCSKEEVYMNGFTDYDFGEDLATNITTGNVTPVKPVVFEEYAVLNDDVYTLGIIPIGFSNSVAGCDVWVSLDDSVYEKLPDTIENIATIGEVQATVEPTDGEMTVATGAFPETFPSFTVTEQRNDRSLCIIGELQAADAELLDFEFFSYRNATTSGSNKILEDCFRGKGYTLPKEHDTDDVAILLGKGLYMRYQPPETDIGKTIYIKCVAFDRRGVREDMDDVTAFTYTIHGYTRKATHVSGLELYFDAAGQGGLTVIGTNATTIQWKITNRNGGPARVAAEEYLNFRPGDTEKWDLLIYDNTKTLVATREDIQDEGEFTADADGVHKRFVYTEAMNTADFAGLTKDIWLGIRPDNAQSYGPDIDLIHVIINT